MPARKADNTTKKTKYTLFPSSRASSRRVKTIQIAIDDFIMDHHSPHL
ncbi:hypothetical protein KDA_04570 [Dictyobacter alpinus]|uniref:Uncharacterized protein n=1 Tax=Dictyobacter alpinus TaxID=2014873 RepID=A0A402B0V1_9CHLR|nr:hypothetical protein KDA_04570 [Dictyobacter alpinus]